MFQTEIHQFLQSFASDGLTSFMRFITTLGYTEFFIVFLLVLLLAVDFKKAFVLFTVLLVTGATTYIFKSHFNLPRPFHVDTSVSFLDGQLPDNNQFDFHQRGATSFWSGLPQDVLNITRKAEEIENGFPSGHTSAAVSFWITLALLFRKSWLNYVAFALIILIPFSRMYLGVHFLADVLGGVLIGLTILGIFYFIVLKPDKLAKYLSKDRYDFSINWTTLAMLISPLLFLLLLPPKVYSMAGFMLGFNIGFLLLARKGLPSSQASIQHRTGRTLVGVLVYLFIGFLVSKLGQISGFEASVWFSFTKNCIIGITLIWLGTELSIYLGWFTRPTTN